MSLYMFEKLLMIIVGAIWTTFKLILIIDLALLLLAVILFIILMFKNMKK